MRRRNHDRERPFTHLADVDHTMAVLSYIDMICLSAMFARWAFHDPSMDDAARTKALMWSCDLERIAEHAGPLWKETYAGADRLPLLKLLARMEQGLD